METIHYTSEIGKARARVHENAKLARRLGVGGSAVGLLLIALLVMELKQAAPGERGTAFLLSAVVLVLAALACFAVSVYNLVQEHRLLDESRKLSLEERARSFREWAAKVVERIDRIAGGKGREALTMVDLGRRPYSFLEPMVTRHAVFRSSEGSWFRVKGAILDGQWSFDGFVEIEEAEARRLIAVDQEAYATFFGQRHHAASRLATSLAGMTT